MKTRTKYNAKKVMFGAIVFDSDMECKFYQHLLSRRMCNLLPIITDIVLQPKFVLIPKFTYFGDKRRELTYTPDFKVSYADGTTEYYDCKGFSTQTGDVRRKLFEYKYPYERLIWITRNLKHGDKDGWIEYDQLKKVRAKAKKDKANETND